MCLGPEWVWLQARQLSSAEGISGKAVSQKSGYDLSSPEGWPGWWTHSQSGTQCVPSGLTWAVFQPAGREGGKAGPGLQGHGSEASHLPSSQVPGQNSLTWLHPPAGSCSVDYGHPCACWKPEVSIRERDGQSIVPGTDAAHPEPRCSVHP